MEVLPVSLFRSDLAASWIEVPKCVRCRNLFIKTKDGNRYPCNVSCGHVLCSTCLTSIRKTEKEAKCPKCSLKLQAKDLSGAVQRSYDYYVMGFSNYQKNFVPNLLKNISQDAPKLMKNAPVCVECAMSTNFICVQCGSNPYCECCFFKVHSVGVLFKQHEIQHKDKTPVRIASEFGLCKCHNQKKTHYCKSCLVPICHSSLTTSHSTHETSSLKAINQKVDLTEPLNLLNTVRQMIEASKKSTTECINKLDKYATSTAQDIFQTFQVYHSILQNLEREAYDDLKKRAQKTLEELHDIQNCVDSSGTQVDGILLRVKQFKKKLPDNIDLSTLNNEVLSFLETTVIDFNFEQFNKNILSFNVNHFKTNCDLKDLCKLSLDNGGYSVKKETFYTTKRPLVDLQASSILPIKTNASVTSSKCDSLQGSDIVIKSRRVTITEIVDMTSFYVQDDKFNERAEQLVEKCNQCAMENRDVDLNSVDVQEMYLVYENNKTKWYRGLVTESNSKSITVYLVDYGRHITVTMKQIRPISDKLKKVPNSAALFQLANVEPKEGKWTDECREVIIQMALMSSATILCVNENSGDCIVHMEYPTSIEDALVYLNYATLRNASNEDEKRLNEKLRREKVKIMQELTRAKPLIKQQLSAEFFASVTNIISPAQIYITPMERVDEIRVLFEKMQKFYEKPYYGNIFYPHLQMVCCACVEDNWYRVRIVAHRPNCMLEVFLVDIGRNANVNWRCLRVLDDQFKNLHEGVTLCSLVDIAPKNYRTWEAAETTELKRLCKNKLKVIVCGKKSRSVEIELYMVKKTVDFQINAYLAKSNFVQWVGDRDIVVERPSVSSPSLNETLTSAAIMKDAYQREFRQTIKILTIESPNKFFITLLKYDGAIKKMHAEIQQMTKSRSTVKDAVEWNIGAYCLVNTKLPNSKDNTNSWYRGRIESISNDDNKIFTVFLRDHGVVVSAELSDINDISSTHSFVIDGASRCHLANIRPTSANWGQAAIDYFKHLTTSGEVFDIFAVSIYGEVKPDSLPVYLWGRKTALQQDPLAGSPIVWKNINEEFASEGFADCFEEFKTIVDCDAVDVQKLHKDMTDLNKWFQKDEIRSAEVKAAASDANILCEDDDFILAAEFDIEGTISEKKVTSWIPPVPVPLYYFHAIPTYVDNNAVIYLHEETKSSYLKQMVYAINKSIDKKHCDEKYVWKKGEPCLVQYHLDKFFYRGEVHEVLPNKKYKVFFVDYGNVEICEANELRIANILADVPMQATKYYLAYVRPISKDGLWDRKILEFIHSKIVNKLVHIRVEDCIDDEYVPITLKVGAMDLGNTLIIEKLAQLTSDLKIDLKLPITYDFYTGDSKSVKRDLDRHKESSVSLDEFQEKIAKRNKAKEMKEYLNKFALNDTLDYLVEDSDVEKNRPSNFFTKDNDYHEEFKPQDTSTTISTATKSFSLLPYQHMKLSRNITKFPCKVYEVLDRLHVFVQPLIEEHVAKIETMEKKIKKSYSKMSEEFNDKSGICIAPFSEDNCYYRAIIVDNVSKTTTRIRFADYLNEEIVERSTLRECPSEIAKIPLKHLLVKLDGIKPSRHVRESDIRRQLATINGKMAMAVVIKNENIPIVRLYEISNQNVLAYQSLIDEKYFLETKD